MQLLQSRCRACTCEGKWDTLRSYCEDEVRILCYLYRRRVLNNPRFHGVIDLRAIAHARTYAPEAPQIRKQRTTHEDHPARQQAELCDLRQKLALYHELCVCLDAD